jgi:hypothetical protein
MKSYIILSLAFTIPFFASSVDSLQRTRVAKVQAAHIMAYSSLAQKPAQLDSDPYEGYIEEDPENGPPQQVQGPIDNKAAEIIDAAVERAMERSGFTWEELRRLAVTVGKVNAAFNSKSAAKLPDTQLVVIVGPACTACNTFKDAVFPGLIASKWTIGKWGEQAKVVTLSIEDYDQASSLQWGLAESDGTYTIPKFLVVRGTDVLSRGRLQKTKTGLELVTDVGIKPMTATGVAEWVNSVSLK